MRPALHRLRKASTGHLATEASLKGDFQLWIPSESLHRPRHPVILHTANPPTITTATTATGQRTTNTSTRTVSITTRTFPELIKSYPLGYTHGAAAVAASIYYPSHIINWHAAIGAHRQQARNHVAQHLPRHRYASLSWRNTIEVRDRDEDGWLTRENGTADFSHLASILILLHKMTQLKVYAALALAVYLDAQNKQC